MLLESLVKRALLYVGNERDEGVGVFPAEECDFTIGEFHAKLNESRHLNVGYFRSQSFHFRHRVGQLFPLSLSITDSVGKLAPQVGERIGPRVTIDQFFGHQATFRNWTVIAHHPIRHGSLEADNLKLEPCEHFGESRLCRFDCLIEEHPAGQKEHTVTLTSAVNAPIPERKCGDAIFTFREENMEGGETFYLWSGWTQCAIEMIG